MVKRDYYKILQVREDADPEVIQAAYRTLSKKYHPDTNKAASAEEKMKQLNEAYGVLSSPEKRQTYDTARRTKPTAAAAPPVKKSTTPRKSKPPAYSDQDKVTLGRAAAIKDRQKQWAAEAAEAATAPRTEPTNPRARDYKWRSYTKLGQELEWAIMTYGPLEAFWLAKYVSEKHTVGVVTKNEVSKVLHGDRGRIFKIAWTDNGREIWDLAL